MQLKHRKILLTGATGGIGKYLAAQLVQHEAEVVLSGRHAAQLEALKLELDCRSAPTCHIAELDLGTEAFDQQLMALQDRHPDISMVINCAGINAFSSIDQQTPAEIETILNVNLTANILICRSFIPKFKRLKEAAIVNVGSTFGSIGYAGYSVYCASKFGLRGFSEALSRELADTDIRVFHIAPRATHTEMNSSTVKQMNEQLGVHVDRPEVVAAQIITAIKRNKQRLFIGWPERFFVKINGLLASVVDRALRKQLPIIRHYLELRDLN